MTIMKLLLLAVDDLWTAIYTQYRSAIAKAYSVTRLIAYILRRFPIIMRLPYFFFSRVQSHYTIGVAAVIINETGHILLVEHSYHPRFPWGLPGGWIDEDEDPTAAILRELREELQLDACVVRVVHTAKTVRNHIDLAFLCKASSPIGKISHELLDYKWVAPDRLPEIKSFHRQSIQSALEHQQRSAQWEQV